MYALRTYFLSTLEQVTNYKLQVATCKLQVASCKLQVALVPGMYSMYLYCVLLFCNSSWTKYRRAGQEENFTKLFSLLFEQDTLGFFLTCFGETEPPIFVPLRIQPVRSFAWARSLSRTSPDPILPPKHPKALSGTTRLPDLLVKA
jgi:hypothetical protein